MAEKSTGQWVGTIVGAIVGFYTGGSTWYAMLGSAATGASVGSAVGGMIDPPKGPNITGPRLSDLNQQMASYGAVVPRLYGTAALAGNIFWIENNSLKEVEQNESQGGKGGGGSEVTTYAYYATFALGLCQGPVDGIRRIWCNGTLIYDAGTIDYETAVASAELARGIRFYSGNDTQLPDSRMQATLGVDDTPAFRGLCYLIFEDFPLRDYGNTLMGAQFKVEVIKAANYDNVTLAVDSYPTPASYVVYPSMAQMVSIAGRSQSTRWVVGNYTNNMALVNLSQDNPVPVVTDISFGGASGLINRWMRLDTILAGVVLYGGGNGTNINLFYYTFNGKDWFAQDWTGWSNDQVKAICEVDGLILYVQHGATGGLSNMRVVGSNGFVYTLPTMPSFLVVIAHDGTADHWILAYASGAIWKYDSGTLTATSVSLPAGAASEVYDIYLEGDVVYRLWKTAVKTSLAWDSFSFSTLAPISSGQVTVPSYSDSMTINENGWPAMHLADNIMTVVGDTYPNNGFNNELGVGIVTTLLNRIAGASEPLADIIEAECLQAPSLVAGDLDTTGISDTVRGYRVSSTGSLRACLEPLQSVWPFDVIQSGYKVKFKRRSTSTSVATIADTELDARAGGDKAGQRLTAVREMNTQLPYRVAMKYLDIDREYDIGEQYAERLNTGSVNQTAVEPPIVLSAQEAARVVEVLLYLYWMERTTLAFALPPTRRDLEPGDIITIPVDGGTMDVRLTDVDHESTGVVRCNARPHNAATYVSTATTDSGVTASSLIGIQGGTNFELLDIPVIVDDYSVSGYIVGIGRYRNGWTGGSVYKSIDDGLSYSSAASAALPSAMGQGINALSAPASFGLIDTASALNATIYVEALASVTEAQMLAGANHFAYGVDGRWEIIAAKTCTLQADGSYTLTNLLRGRFGTEAYASQHIIGDKLVMLSRARLQFIQASINQIGLAALFKSATFGSALDDYPGRAFTYRGVNLKPLAPVYLNGSRHPSTNDWSLEWLRRSRIGGEWRDGVDVPLGEAREAYDVEIYSSSAYTTIKRTFSGLTTPAASYTSAQQVADFGSNQSTLYVKVYQLSDSIGRGSALTTSITR
jgi:hypothetical protein